ncbi:transcriptional regulator, AraC family [Methylobacterium sp. 4-46]|uniref:AraC family transcriptional regulator n=1 Tax=unclassified Methylobacterium TaxID=2615210 RepID=UPI000152CEDF|nr:MULTISPECIES: AraC family transcriptional regulator [Methylobacterium]ACA16079.1 transcriptional regulator, AraC family [Methylobacterium sp. 4-46]WFT81790.1 AraC family transcriptional regulator [Methylobacterium nodulans]
MMSAISWSCERSRPEARRAETSIPPRPAAPAAVHGSAVEAICEVLVALGIEPAPLLVQSGIGPRCLEGAGALSFESLGRLMALAARRSACPHFGLLVGQRTTLASLGLLGVLMRNSETVGDALRVLETHHGLLNRGAVIRVAVNGPLAIASYSPYRPEAEGIALHCERALTAMTNVIRSLCGGDWAPEEVLLPRLGPDDATPYANVFRAPVRFGQEIAALTFPARLLGRPIGDASPIVRKLAEQRIRQFAASMPADLTDELRRHLRATLTQGELSARQAAEALAVHRRTLSRRLRAEGTSFRSVANETRLSVAKQLLADTNLSLAEISVALEFSEPAAFTHAFRRWTGTTPSAWRKQRRDPSGGEMSDGRRAAAGA